jgi:hypothetical protein
MKKFILSVLCVSVFFVGLGALVEKAGAKFKSDDRALALIAQARQAIGGDQNLAAVKGLVITGKVTKSFDMNGTARSEQGDVEIAMQMPDKFSRMMKIGRHDGAEGQVFEKNVDVVMVAKDGENAKVRVIADGPGDEAGQVVKMRKVEDHEITTVDGPETTKGNMVFVRKTEDGATFTTDNDNVHKVIVRDGPLVEGKTIRDGQEDWHAAHQNEMVRTTLSLLLTAPEGVDVGYTYAGEESVDGSPCDVINVEGAGSSFKLYLDKSSHLPKMIGYQAAKPMVFTFRTKEDGAKGAVTGSGEPQVITVRTRGGDATPAGGETQVFARRMAAPEMAQFQIKFSDFRNVNGVQLPYRWTQTVGGKDDEVIDITGYDVNPANIAEKFQNERVFVRTRKPENPQ